MADLITSRTNILQMGYDRWLNKPDPFYTELPNLKSSIDNFVPTLLLTSGETTGNIDVKEGYLQSTEFVSGSVGWRIDAEGNLEANDGNFRGDITGATGTFSGSLIAGSIHIPDQDTTANSFHVDTTGAGWVGATETNKATAPMQWTAGGGLTVSDLTVTGASGIASFTDAGDLVTTNEADVDALALTNAPAEANADVTSTNETFSQNSDIDALQTTNGPADASATVGATAGTDLKDSGASTLDDEDVVKFANTIYGDGSDGDLTTTGNVTLTADTYYDTLTIATGDTVTTAGYRLFCKTKLITQGTGKVDWSGNNGANAAGAGGAAGGAALSAGTIQGSAKGGDGGNSATNGDNGVAAAVSIGASGVAGGDDGDSVNTGGTAGTATASPTKPRSYPFCVMLAHITDNAVPQLMDSSAGSGGGAGGAGSAAGGGGAGSAGGVIMIAAREIENAGAIQSHGGNGGNGFNSFGAGSGPGGGGGGSGGVIILVYNKYSGAGTKTVTAGTGGAGGTASNTGANGANGNVGSVIPLQF